MDRNNPKNREEAFAIQIKDYAEQLEKAIHSPKLVKYLIDAMEYTFIMYRDEKQRKQYEQKLKDSQEKAEQFRNTFGV